MVSFFYLSHNYFVIIFAYTESSNGIAAFGSRNSSMLIGSIDCPPYSYGFYECTLDSIDAKQCPLDQDLYIHCRNSKHCHCINVDLNKNNNYNEKLINYFIDI